jgi:hypothetical protein
LAVAGLLIAQRNDIAWKTNPTASVMDQLEQAKISNEVKQALMHDDRFMLAVGGLLVPGTRQMVSEENYNNAVCAAMDVFSGQIRGEGNVGKQTILAHEMVNVLKALRFRINIESEIKTTANTLNIQLTPTSQPAQTLMLNNRFIRSIQQLNQLGVNLNIPVQWQPDKPMKLKTSDGAA